MRALRPRRLRALQPVQAVQPLRGGLRAVRPLQSLRAVQSVRAVQSLQPLRGRVAGGESAGRRDRFAAPASPLNAAAAASMVARVA